MKSFIEYIPTFIILLSVLFTSCSDRQVLRMLDDVDTYISERPDSALAVLDSLSGMDIRGREANARFALLYSMALDKNYIDLTDDSLINVAVGWYRRHGTADERLKAWYYQGRVYENAGDNEKAMESFVRAEEYAGVAKDYAAAGRLYRAKSLIYSEIFNYNQAVENAKKSAGFYIRIPDYNKYAGNMCEVANNYMVLDSLEAADKYLKLIKEYWSSIDDRTKSWYYKTLMYLDNHKSVAAAMDVAVDYVSEVHPNNVDWISVADIYCSAGMPDSALVLIENYKKYNDYDAEIAFYSVMSDIYETLGSSDKALEYYKDYIYVTDSIDLEIFDADTKFIEERHAKDMEILKKHNRVTILIMSLVILLLAGVIVGRYVRQKMHAMAESRHRVEEENTRIRAEKVRAEEDRKKYERLYSKVLSERDLLKKSIGMATDASVRKMMQDRFSVLEKYVAAHLSGNMSHEAGEELEKLLSDRESFLQSTRLSFAFSHPGFLSYLKGRGLTEEEIGICCLYGMGLHGKEIGTYLGRKGYYNYSSSIRRKLGLDSHGQHIDGYLRDILQKTDSGI